MSGSDRPPSNEDGPLVAASDVQTREQVAAIVREHSDYVWRTLRWLGVQVEDIDDVSQEVFIVVLRKLHTYEGRASLRAWLRGVCIRMAAQRRKQFVRKREVLEAEPDPGPARQNPENEVAAARGLETMQRAVDALDDAKREVFVLYELEGLTMKQVAESVGAPLQTVYSRYRAARDEVTSFVRRAELPKLPVERADGVHGAEEATS